jgi:hypothetical protein
MKEPKLHHVFTMEQLDEASEAGAGYCVACGAWRDHCKPDAFNYPCEECGEREVFGAEELLLMGYVRERRDD